MTLPLIRARTKPHFGLPWLAIRLGLGTVRLLRRASIR